MPCAAAGLCQIDASQKQHEFFVAEGDFVFLAFCCRPPEATLFQTLRTHPETAAIPEQELQTVALRIREQKDMAAQRITRQTVAHQSEETFKALAHVRRSGRKIDACGGSDAEHDQASSARTNWRSVRASNPRFTSMRSPPWSTTVSSLPLRGSATSTATNRRDCCGWLPPAVCLR